MILLAPIPMLVLGLSIVLYWQLRSPARQRDLLLSGTVVILILWDIQLAAILLAAGTLAWYGARRLSVFEPGTPERWHWFVATLTGLLAALAAIKLAGFYQESATSALARFGQTPSWPVLNLVVPIGLTFTLIQAIGYVIDVWRGEMRARTTLRNVFAFMLFFPGLAGGPLLSAQSLCDEFKRAKCLTRDTVTAAIRALATGFVLKFAIADPVGAALDPVFLSLAQGPDTPSLSNLALAGATVVVGAQILFDLAGCALMAVGLARLFGFALPSAHGPATPAPSLSALLTRLHPTLSGWLNAYIVTPATAHAPDEARLYRPVFLLTGIGLVLAAGDGPLMLFITGLGLLVAMDTFFIREPGIGLPRAIGTGAAIIALLSLVPFLRADTPGAAFTLIAAALGERTGGTDPLPWTLWCIPVLLALTVWAANRDVPRAKPRASLANPALHWAGIGMVAALLLAFMPLPAAT